MQQAYYNGGQLCEIVATASGCGDSTYYAGGFFYNAPGKLLNFTYGNGVAAAFQYSPNRTQLTSLDYVKGTTNLFDLQYSYQQSSPYSPNARRVRCGTMGRSSASQMWYRLGARQITATT